MGSDYNISPPGKVMVGQLEQCDRLIEAGRLTRPRLYGVPGGLVGGPRAC